MKHEIPPDTCHKCHHFSFRGICQGWMLDARCDLVPATQDWYAKESPDKRGGWIGEDITKQGYTGYYYYHHCVYDSTRAKDCPLLAKGGGKLTVRQFIQKLMDECENLDAPIGFYVSAEQEKLKKIIEEDGQIDDFLDVKEIDDLEYKVNVRLSDIEV